MRLCQNGGVREPRMNHLRGSLFLLAVVCVVGAAQAQVVTSNLQGVVTDPTGAVVANAVITATNVETAVHRTATTNGEGFYRFNLLPRGSYEVKAQKSSFATATLKVNLTVGDTITAKATDAAGNTSAASTALSVKIDTAVPASSVTNPANGASVPIWTGRSIGIASCRSRTRWSRRRSANPRSSR